MTKLPASRQLRLEKKFLIRRHADLSNRAVVKTHKNVVKLSAIVRIGVARFAGRYTYRMPV